MSRIGYTPLSYKTSLLEHRDSGCAVAYKHLAKYCTWPAVTPGSPTRTRLIEVERNRTGLTDCEPVDDFVEVRKGTVGSQKCGRLASCLLSSCTLTLVIRPHQTGGCEGGIDGPSGHGRLNFLLMYFGPKTLGYGGFTSFITGSGAAGITTSTSEPLP